MTHKTKILLISTLTVLFVIGGSIYFDRTKKSPTVVSTNETSQSALEKIKNATTSALTSLPDARVAPQLADAADGIASASALAIPANEPTPVTVGIQISDSRLIQGSVNLQRLDSAGRITAVLGTLTGNGSNFSIRQTLNEPAPNPIKLQVSWALKGVLKRSTSNALSITPIALPPDPGEAGKQMLAGIDSDKDGIRDDVQRYIALNYSGSEKIRAALGQSAIATQAAVLHADDKLSSIQHANQEISAYRCMTFIMGNELASSADGRLQAQILNTDARSVAYIHYEGQVSGQVFDGPPREQFKSLCNFNPDALRN